MCQKYRIKITGSGATGTATYKLLTLPWTGTGGDNFNGPSYPITPPGSLRFDQGAGNDNLTPIKSNSGEVVAQHGGDFNAPYEAYNITGNGVAGNNFHM